MIGRMKIRRWMTGHMGAVALCSILVACHSDSTEMSKVDGANESPTESDSSPIPVQSVRFHSQGVSQVKRPETVEFRLAYSEYESSQATKVLKHLCDVLEGRSSSILRPRLTPTFGGRWPAGLKTREKISALTASPVWLNGDTFLDELANWASFYREVEHCRVKHFLFEMAPDRSRAFAQAHLTVQGIDREGAPHAVTADLTLAYVGPEWRMEAISWSSGRAITREAWAFQPVGPVVGVAQFASDESKSTLQSEVDAGALETMGGLVSSTEWGPPRRHPILDTRSRVTGTRE